MKRTLFILTGLLLTTSCATVTNELSMTVTVYTTKPSKIIYHRDTVATSKNKVKLSVERQKAPLKFAVTTDSLTKTIHVKSRNSLEYWCNIGCNYGIGMLVDRKNPKRYAYPRRIYLNLSDTLNIYKTYRQQDKGVLCLHFSFPHINFFNFKPENYGRKINAGFLGVTFGVDYYHTKNQFVNLGISGVMDFIVPAPAPIDIKQGKYESMGSTYISLSNNHRFGRFSTGYGICYGVNTWIHRYYFEVDQPSSHFFPTLSVTDRVEQKVPVVGLIFPNYFQVGRSFHIGLIYRPTLYKFAPVNKFVYEHLISIDFGWKIRVAKINVK